MTKPALLAEVRWVSRQEYMAMRTTVRWCPDSAARFPPVAQRRGTCLADCPAVMLTGRRDQFDAAMAGRPMLAR